MNVSGPVAAIIVALIFSGTAIFASSSAAPNTYATINYDGGYKKLGVISSEEIFTTASLANDDGEFLTGDFDEVMAGMAKSLRAGSNGQEKLTTETAAFKPGVTLTASSGIRWVGSESLFDLTTDTISLTSTEANNLSHLEVIKQLKGLQAKAKAGRLVSSQNALTLGPAPEQSFLISKILAALTK